MKIYIVGINSFIGKNVYLKLRQNNIAQIDTQIYCLSHKEIHLLELACKDDIVINFCGINRANSEFEYMEGNYLLLEKMVNILNKESLPYLIHLSSYMVHGFNGFNGVSNNNLTGYMKMFVESKLKGEEYLMNNYPFEKLCILRPSNVYGYNCEPYYNNILVTLIYEKITNNYKTTKINKNCVRNFISIDGLVNAIISIIKNRDTGCFNIVSSSNVHLDKLIKILHSDNINNFDIFDGEISVPNNDNELCGETIVVNENLEDMIIDTKNKMKRLIEIKQLCPYKTLNKLSQPRGEMVEISDLRSSRLYMITITQNSFRGNHFHYKQIEEFYVNKGKCIFLLAHKDEPNVIMMCILNKYDVIQVSPYIIHTLVNDFTNYNNENHITELFITSTQEYVPNSTIDTEYVNLL